MNMIIVITLYYYDYYCYRLGPHAEDGGHRPLQEGARRMLYDVR